MNEKIKKVLLTQKSLNIVLFLFVLYFLMIITGKYFLLIGDTEMASSLFRLTLNRSGRALSLAGSGDYEKALDIAGDNRLLQANIFYSMQKFSEAAEMFRKAGDHEGTFYSLIGSGQIDQAKNVFETVPDAENKMIAIKEASAPYELLPELVEMKNYFGAASLFLKSNS